MIPKSLRTTTIKPSTCNLRGVQNRMNKQHAKKKNQIKTKTQSIKPGFLETS